MKKKIKADLTVKDYIFDERQCLSKYQHWKYIPSLFKVAPQLFRALNNYGSDYNQPCFFRLFTISQLEA